MFEIVKLESLQKSVLNVDHEIKQCLIDVKSTLK